MSDSDSDHPHGLPASRHSLSDLSCGTDWASVCADMVDAHGVAIVATTASHPDSRRVAGSTCATAARVADLLYVLGVGPDAVSMVDGVVCTVVVDDVVDRARWPVLVNELTALGVGWVQTYPIHVGGCVIGTVQLHRRTPPDTPLPDGIATLLTHLTRAIGADIILGLLDDCAAAADADIVNIAIGALAARHATTVDTASAMLRAGAFARGHTSMCEALHIVDSIGGPDLW